MNLGSHLSFKVTKSDFLKKKSGSKIISSKRAQNVAFQFFRKTDALNISGFLCVKLLQHRVFKLLFEKQATKMKFSIFEEN